MRHLVALPVVATLAAAGSLQGCSTLSTVTPTTISATTTTLIQDVTQITTAACGFVPSAETIAALATAGNTQAGTALTLASSIAAVVCGAVKAGTATSSVALRGVRLRNGRRGVVLPSVDGVPITGYFVAPAAAQ